MIPPRPSAGRVILILARVGMHRWLNRFSGQLLGAFRRRLKRPPPHKRTATPGKKRKSLVLTVLFGGLFLFGVINIASSFVRGLGAACDRRFSPHPGQIGVSAFTYQAILDAEKDIRAGAIHVDGKPVRLGVTEEEMKPVVKPGLEFWLKDEADRQRGRRGDSSELHKQMMEQFEQKGSAGFYVARQRPPQPWPSVSYWSEPPGQKAMIFAVAVVMNLLGVAILFMTFGSQNQDLGKVEWTLEWLFTFPAGSGALFLAQALQFTLFSAAGWLVNFALCFAVFWSAGYRGWAAPLAVPAALYLNLIQASVRLLGETWLRKTFPLGRLKNLQAGFTILGSACFLGMLVLAHVEGGPEALVGFAGGLGEWVLWLPLSLPAGLCRGGAAIAAPAAAMVVLGVGLPLAAAWAAGRLVRGGLIAHVSPYQGPRRPAAKPGRVGVFRGIVGKELRLLIRDRNFMAQTLILPVLVVAVQIIVNPAISRSVRGDLRSASILAFVVAAYVLMCAAFQVLTAEGKALWLLYTFPRRLERIMLRKAMLWAAVSCVYALAVLVVAFARQPAFAPGMLLDPALAIAGVCIYAFIAAGIGVMATNPLEQHLQRRMRPSMMYLYMLLVSLYAYGIYTPDVWHKSVQVVLCALVAYAIWQKVADRMPLLLDPTAVPAPKVGVSDGLIAAFAFFVIQGAIALGVLASGASLALALVIAYMVSGFVVFLITALVLWARKVPNLLGALGIRPPPGAAASSGKAALTGLAWGAAAAGFGVVYLFSLEHLGPLREIKRQTLDLTRAVGPSGLWWIGVLVVFAAPVFEEYLFRGLLFRGLSRSFRPTVAVLASAAIFAVIHPPISVLPVFGLGLAAAMSFRSGHLLIAPILTHMTYNAAVFFANRAL